MAKPLEKKYDTCPMLARSDWGVGQIQHKGLSHALSEGQSAVGFHGPKTGGWLIFQNGCHRGEDMRIPIGETRVGSSWLSDLVLTGIGIGSQHAVIRVGAGKAEISPSSVDRIIKVNNEVISGVAELSDGCLITLGELHGTFRFSDQMNRGYQPQESPRPIQMPSQSSQREIVCGWLVISKGVMLGKDFRLVNGSNRIGSGLGIELTLAEPHLAKHALTLLVTPKECKVSFVCPGKNLFINGVESPVGTLLRESDSIAIDQLEGYLKWLLP